MEIRSITDDEVTAWRRSLAQTFGMDPAADPQGDERVRATLDLSRTFAAFDRGAIVATTAGFDFTLAVPGGSVPMSGLTMVTVRPTHRRRGLLRALIQEHLEAARRHGDAVSGLWASEATIYGRFGYGIAAEADTLTVHMRGVSLAEDEVRDEVELVSDADAATVVPPVYERAFSDRPGMFSRTAAWWQLRRFSERADQRAGASPRKYAVAFRDGRGTGYVAYRQRLVWDEGLPAGSVEIDELMAVDARAEATLWHYLAHVDLFPKVSWRHCPVDSLLPWLIDNRRRLVCRRADTLWLRIDDVPRALAARRYPADGALCLGVEGEVVALEVEAGVGRCERVDAPPDLVLDRPTLGAIYLGAFTPSLLARAGRISGVASAVALADRLFGWHVAAWCPEIF